MHPVGRRLWGDVHEQHPPAHAGGFYRNVHKSLGVSDGICFVPGQFPDFRLICRVRYANRWTDGTLLVKHFLTHSEYDKNKWCKDCTLPEDNA